MAKTEVPETVVCPNCSHKVVIKLYKVDVSINSSQGRFHTVYHRREPAYTVYCINCGHFITNDPKGTPPKSDDSAKTTAAAKTPPRRAPSKRKGTK
ncbi:MAG: hypothetical protein OXF11_19545 [Deltaproteobacteria bacterium]|nr:hypothetical protein [Deltaproteobacteria bacterium]